MRAKVVIKTQKQSREIIVLEMVLKPRLVA